MIRGFRFLRQQNWYKKIDKSKYSICRDAGKSFRCAQTIWYLFKELASEKIHGMMFKLFYYMRQFLKLIFPIELNKFNLIFQGEKTDEKKFVNKKMLENIYFILIIFLKRNIYF